MSFSAQVIQISLPACTYPPVCPDIYSPRRLNTITHWVVIRYAGAEAQVGAPSEPF